MFDGKLIVMGKTMTGDQTTFGTRLLSAVREAGGPTKQEPLSKWFREQHGINVSGAMLNKYKNKDLAPRINQCREFAGALGVTVEWLYTGRGARYPTDGPLTQTEVRILGMWRKLTPQLKRLAFGFILELRVKPDIAAANIRSEEELDALVIDTVTEAGDPRIKHEFNMSK